RPAAPRAGPDERRHRRRGRPRPGGARHPGGARAPARSPRGPVRRLAGRRPRVPRSGGGRGMSDVLAEQKRYYAERAPEYDDWWYRRGRFELGAEELARWQGDIAEAEAALAAFAPHGRVLELAAGTGIWTRKLVRPADHVVAVDANAETLALNTSEAELVRADIFEW